MYRRILVFKCKVLIKLLRLVGKNGSALPGLIIERLDPGFLTNMLKPVENKIILVTGTNGKTTSTKMLVASLRGAGARVVTNATGSNMTRGLIAAIIEDMTYFGTIKPTDWFVFEMDEAYTPIFTRSILPKCLLALNVLRDQLDRYGELDKTAQLIEMAAKKSKIFVYNQLDPLLSKIAARLKGSGVVASAFGVSDQLVSHVENEQSLHGEKVVISKGGAIATLLNAKAVEDLQKLTVKSNNRQYKLTIPIKGFHNALNATAVVAALSSLKVNELEQGIDALSQMPTPFGRGEKLHIKDKNITVALVKNPSGFMSNLETFVKQGQPQLILFVVNDKFADGRDVSWLWDVDFKPFISSKTILRTSGIRGYDIALRLKHDNFDVSITTDISAAIQSVIASEFKEIVIIPTYTALFEVRDALSKYGRVARIW